MEMVREEAVHQMPVQVALEAAQVEAVQEAARKAAAILVPAAWVEAA